MLTIYGGVGDADGAAVGVDDGAAVSRLDGPRKRAMRPTLLHFHKHQKEFCGAPPPRRWVRCSAVSAQRMGTLPFEWVGPELQIRKESGPWRMQMVEDFGRDDGVYGAVLYNLRERATCKPPRAPRAPRPGPAPTRPGPPIDRRKERLCGDAARFCRIVTVFPNTAATPQNAMPPVQPLVPLIVFDPALPSEEADLNTIPFLFESTKNAKNGGVAFLARCGHGIRLYLPWQAKAARAAADAAATRRRMQATAARDSQTRPVRKIAGMQHWREPPGRPKQPCPPHSPHVALQQT